MMYEHGGGRYYWSAIPIGIKESSERKGLPEMPPWAGP